MGDISRPDVLQNCGITNYIQHIFIIGVIRQSDDVSRMYVSIFRFLITQI